MRCVASKIAFATGLSAVLCGDPVFRSVYLLVVLYFFWCVLVLDLLVAWSGSDAPSG